MASKYFCKGSKFSYIGLDEIELPVSERSEYPRFFVLKDGKIVYKLYTDRNFEGIYTPSKSGEMIEISRGLRLPQTREGSSASFVNGQPRNWKVSPKKNIRRCLYFALYALF